MYFMKCLATCGAFAVGAALGWTSPSSPRLTKQEEYGFSVSEEEVIGLCTMGIYR